MIHAPCGARPGAARREATPRRLSTGNRGGVAGGALRRHQGPSIDILDTVAVPSAVPSFPPPPRGWPGSLSCRPGDAMSADDAAVCLGGERVAGDGRPTRAGGAGPQPSGAARDSSVASVAPVAAEPDGELGAPVGAVPEHPLEHAEGGNPPRDLARAVPRYGRWSGLSRPPRARGGRGRASPGAWGPPPGRPASPRSLAAGPVGLSKRLQSGVRRGGRARPQAAQMRSRRWLALPAGGGDLAG